MEDEKYQIKWEVSIIELQGNGKKKFKITRRIPYLSVSETKIFDSKDKAKKLFDKWLEQTIKP